MTDDFEQALAQIVADPNIRSLAARWAGDLPAAEDALQNTYYNLARSANRNPTRNLQGYFLTALRSEILRRRYPPRGIETAVGKFGIEENEYLANDTEASWEDLDPLRHPVTIDIVVASFETQVEMRLLCETWLARLASHSQSFEARIPKRSRDHQRYRKAIVDAAKRIIWCAVNEHSYGTVNDTLRAVYPDWFDEPAIESSTLYWRTSRGHRDLKRGVK